MPSPLRTVPASNSPFTEDPTILSGTLHSTLDVFGEYSDAEIVSGHPLPVDITLKTHQFEALRRIHLIPSSEEDDPVATINTNVFRDLDSPVSKGSENFSAG